MGEDKKRREPLLHWLSAIGVGVLLIAVIRVSNEAPAGLWFLIGVVLVVGGVVARSISRTRQASS